ncbi:MAG: hypothetical protein RLZZ219_656 [Cyanobacteriota bacterium]|jgi:hypothetical protein
MAPSWVSGDRGRDGTAADRPDPPAGGSDGAAGAPAEAGSAVETSDPAVSPSAGPADGPGDHEGVGTDELLVALQNDRAWLLQQIDEGRWPDLRLDLAALERELGQLLEQAQRRFGEG